MKRQKMSNFQETNTILMKNETENEKNVHLSSSQKWRKLYSSPLIEILDKKIDKSSISKIYSLLFFLANENNFRDCVQYITNKNYKEMLEMMDLVPFDFDEKDYPMYDLVYVIGVNRNYFAIIYDSGKGGKKDISLEYISETENIDISRFLGRRLIYPV